MARIQTYAKDNTLSDKDKVIGSNFTSTLNGIDQFTTRNFTMKELRGFIGFDANLLTATETNNVHTCDISLGNNFQIIANNNLTSISFTVTSSDVGKSGTIILVNHANGTTYNQLPSIFLTPDNSNINFVTTGNAISIISYFIFKEDKILTNYVGNYA
tara:strand:+ start:228 stop:701 length:474 start_codon:yes stop_codon:yes gene_type:complete